ncbi:MAG: tetratricopeptide repeat protein, partial [Bacteroidota bacterium]
REITDAKAQEVVTLYTGYVDANPWDSISPHYLFKAAEVNIGIKQHKAAISLYERLLEHYPEYDKRPETLYLIGFTYENHLDQMGKAREQYEALIEAYPSHKLAQDARYAIENLGLSDEELIEKFKAMQEEQAAN